MNSKSPGKTRPGLRRILFGVSVAFILTSVIAFFIYESAYDHFAPYFRSLPSDEEMINNFEEHRADFERLSQMYREEPSIRTSVGVLGPSPKIESIMKRMNVSFIMGDGEIWVPPGPDSKSAGKKLLHRASPADTLEERKFSGVIFGYAHKRVVKHEWPVYKQYYYIPLIPSKSGGKLRLPQWGIRAHPVVVDTLNDYLPRLEFLGAACREIEPHWYIEIRQD
jgi:hypothetical protein